MNFLNLCIFYTSCLIYVQLYVINYVFRFKVIIYMHIEERQAKNWMFLN